MNSLGRANVRPCTHILITGIDTTERDAQLRVHKINGFERGDLYVTILPFTNPLQ